MRAFLKSATENYRFTVGALYMCEDVPLWKARFQAAFIVALELVGLAICNLRGHDFDTNGCDYLESGGEGFSCSRCGHSFTAWHH